MPPAPVPTITPILSRSDGVRVSKSIPESFAASSVAKNAIGIARCTRSLSFLEMKRSKSKSLTSAATRHDNFDASKRVIGPVPLTPRAVASQNASRPIPLGLTAPIPVTTTLFNSIKSSSSAPVLAYGSSYDAASHSLAVHCQGLIQSVLIRMPLIVVDLQGAQTF